MIKVILIGGKKFAGKSTLANMIIEHGNMPCSKLSFASPFKRILVEGNILTEKQAYGDDTDKNTKTNVIAGSLNKEIAQLYSWRDDHRLSAREVMQVFGNDLCKQLDQQIWINTARNSVNEIAATSDDDMLFLMDDFRFNNLEDQFDYPVIKLFIKRSDQIEHTDGHASENSFKEEDADLVLITNHSDDTNLYANTLKAIKLIKAGEEDGDKQ